MLSLLSLLSLERTADSIAHTDLWYFQTHSSSVVYFLLYSKIPPKKVKECQIFPWNQKGKIPSILERDSDIELFKVPLNFCFLRFIRLMHLHFLTQSNFFIYFCIILPIATSVHVFFWFFGTFFVYFLDISSKHMSFGVKFPASHTCAPPFTKYHEGCYLVVSERRNRDSAQAYCQQQGSSVLGIVRSFGENVWLKGVVSMLSLIFFLVKILTGFPSWWTTEQIASPWIPGWAWKSPEPPRLPAVAQRNTCTSTLTAPRWGIFLWKEHI